MVQAQTAISRRPRAGHAAIAGTLSTPLMEFDLLQEIHDLRSAESWQRGTGRSSKTLVKHPDLRIVLVLMKANTTMREHKAAARVSVQTISGELCLHLPDQTIEVPAGHLVTLDQCIPHDAEARKETAFLLTLSWPPERNIEERKTHK